MRKNVPARITLSKLTRLRTRAGRCKLSSERSGVGCKMREIVLDTETTGFDPQQGDRIVEIGAVELYNHMPTGRTFHEYINPQRGMPQDAFDIHGIGPDLLD